VPFPIERKKDKKKKTYTGNSTALATMAANAPQADPIKSNA